MSSLQDQSNSHNIRRLQFAGIFRFVGILLIFLLPILGAFLLTPPLGYQAMAGWVALLALYACSQPLTFLVRRAKSGTTLVDLGYLNKVSGWSIIGSILFGILWFILSLTTALRSPALAIAQLGLCVFHFADALSKFIANREPTLITEKGIYGPKSMLPWNRIQARQWLNQHENALLILKFKKRPWPFDETTLSIPVSFKAEVDRIIAEKCTG
jgi:hypothetical protein